MAQVHNLQHYKNTICSSQSESEQIACMLHDSVTQTLTVLGMRLNRLQKMSAGNTSDEINDLVNKCVEVQQVAEKELKEIMHKAKHRNIFIEGDNMRQVVEYSTNILGLQVVVHGSEVLESMPEPIQSLASQLIRETLINVRKHAGVNKAYLRYKVDHGHLVVNVKDDGNGFVVSQFTVDEESHLGGHILKQRVESIGGEMKIDSTPGEGTTVTFVLPIVADDQFYKEGLKRA